MLLALIEVVDADVVLEPAVVNATDRACCLR
jgi:hypothetical protein